MKVCTVESLSRPALQSCGAKTATSSSRETRAAQRQRPTLRAPRSRRLPWKASARCAAPITRAPSPSKMARHRTRTSPGRTPSPLASRSGLTCAHAHLLVARLPLSHPMIPPRTWSTWSAVRSGLEFFYPVLVPVRASPVPSVRKKERKQATQGRDGRTARRHHTGILRRGVWCASRRPPLGVGLFLSLSSFFPLSLLLLSRRSPLPRSATPPPPAGPLFSRLLSPFGATPSSSRRILAPRVYRAPLAQGPHF